MESAKIIEVIETKILKGDGEKTPIRKVVQYWDQDGELLAERDPWMVSVPQSPTPSMLNVVFYGDLGSGVPGWHKYLRQDEYWFATEEQAMEWGADLYKAMIRQYQDDPRE